MATGLANRPDQDSDYDPVANLANLESELDSKYGDQFAALDKDNGPGAIKAAEEGISAPPESDNVLGKGFSDDDQGGLKGFRLKLSRNQKIGGGVAGGVVTLAVAGFGYLQGPLQLIHFAQLMQRFHFSNNEEFGNDRSSRYIRHLLSGSAERSRLGAVGNRYADKWELRLNNESGLKSVYSSPPNKRFLGYEVIDEGKARNLTRELESDGIDVDGNKPQGVSGRFIDLSDSRFGSRRSLIRTVVRNTGTNRISSSIGSRLLIKRAGIDFHPFKNVQRKAGDKLIDYYNERKRERAERRERGIQDYDVGAAEGENADRDGDGNPDPPSSDVSDAEREAREAVGDIADVEIDGPSAVQQLRNSLAGKLAGGAAAAVGIMCTVKGLGDEAKAMRYTNTILPMMRMGGEIVTAGNQVMSGKGMNMAEVGSLASDLHDEESGLNWSASRSIQAELGKDPTGPDIAPHLKPSRVSDQPALFDILNGIPGLSAACGVSDAISGLPIISHVSNLTSSVLNTFIPIDRLVEGIVGLIAGKSVNSFAQGAELGNIVNYGSRMAANDVAISMGGQELSQAQTAQLDSYNSEAMQAEFKERGFFARTFDIYDSRSAVGQMAISAPTNFSSMFTGLLKSPFTNFSKIFSHQVGAAEEPYDYGFNEFGFSLAEQQDPSFDDPFANAEYIEAIIDPATQRRRLDVLNEMYGECFSMQVKINGNETRLESGEATKFYEIPEKCKSSNPDPDLRRYRFYIADNVTAHSLACYEGTETSCQMLMGTSATSTAGAGGVSINPDGFAFPLRTTKSTITSHSPRWCFESQANCHHDYNAADIFAPTGTVVVAARGGTVMTVRDFDSAAVGSRVTIKGDDGNLYYYTHMGEGTLKVRPGQQVAAGTELGAVGTSADAVGTDPHLHFDILPSSYSSRPGCSGSACTRYPFINPQPALVSSFNGLP